MERNDELSLFGFIFALIERRLCPSITFKQRLVLMELTPEHTSVFVQE